MGKFWIDCFVATTFVFLTMFGVYKITQLDLEFFNSVDSIGSALGDVELTDLVFNKLRDDPNVYENIVVVNIGDLSRRGVAEQIRIISQYKPKVIGVDAFFDCKTGLRDTVNCPGLKDEMGNLMLSNAIKEAGNVVLVTKVLQTEALVATEQDFEFDSLRRSDPAFRDFALAEGYASLETDAAYQDDVKTCRSFNPVLPVKDSLHRAFSVQLAFAYDSALTRKFLARDNASEIINYRGNIFDFYGQTNYPQMFFTLDVDQVFNEDFVPEMITDKIVIFGYLGKDLRDPSWADKFYTPLNKKMAGKSNPDMFGVVVHANIVSMILTSDYVDEMDESLEFAMAFIFCLLNVALFSLIYNHLPSWYDGITKLLQLIQIIVYSAVMVFIFHWYSFKLNITYTLIAVALVGDVFEVYMSVIKNLINKFKNRLGLTKSTDEVLTS